MSSDIQQRNKDKKRTISIATTLIALLTFASLTISLDSTAFAQGNQTTTTGASSSSPNQTGAQVTGPPETTVLNKTTVPAQQTNVTVNQTTEPVSPQALQPLENLTQSQTTVNLSGFENKTMVTPTGNATTTTVNKTTVPFNQTMVTAGEANQTTGQGQQGQQQQNQTQQQQNQTGGNQTGGAQNQTQKGPLEQLGESLGKMFGQQK
ncbi:MAG TPA: hypothetical protein VFS97_14295 [Nitrososphaeraceae archaeon]|nr:hypothetical protein [Nitrososphaeraceae archaeon]